MSKKQAVTPTVSHYGWVAVRLQAPNNPARLVYERVKTPQPSPGEVLVRVHVGAITRGELEWPADRLPTMAAEAVAQYQRCFDAAAIHVICEEYG